MALAVILPGMQVKEGDSSKQNAHQDQYHAHQAIADEGQVCSVLGSKTLVDAYLQHIGHEGLGRG